MFSKNKRQAVTIITRISVIGVMVISAALIIVLSSFNGIESMISELYTEFDQGVTITPSKGKTIFESQVPWAKLAKTDGILRMSKGIEETVILRNEEKWVNATILGVEPQFLEMINIHNKDHLIMGRALLPGNNQEQNDFGLIGAGLANNLAISNIKTEPDNIIIYAPKNDLKLKFGKNPFFQTAFNVSGIINYNKETNDAFVVANLGFVTNLLNLEGQITHIYIQPKSTIDNESLKLKIQELVGPNFVVKTNAQKNELIYKTSKSEKLIVIMILLFIFLLAAFNLVASITMIYLEKKDGISVLKSIGLSKTSIFKVFFLEGILIAGTGILLGFFLGLGICLAQLKYTIITIPGAGIAFPVEVKITEILSVLIVLIITATAFSFFTARYLVNDIE
ncbi:MAG: ABC transporter permease [Crocinitomicaceae bacterium]|nr:ABC transporter permease [Crocinitomicaceae bacterium]